MSSPVDFKILSALEAELGRPRVREMAAAYLADCRAHEVFTLSTPTTPVRPAPIIPPLWYSVEGAGFPTTPPPRRPELLMPPGAPRRPSRSAAGGGPEPHSPVAGVTFSPVLSSLAPSASISSTGTTIAPLQDDEDAAGGGGHHPNLEDTCPRHSHINRRGLGPSKNSSGQWAMYTPLGNGCDHCKADEAEEKAIGDLYTMLEIAQAGDGAAVREGLRAVEAFREANPYLVRMDVDIIEKELKALIK